MNFSLCGFYFVKSFGFDRRPEQERPVGRKPLNPLLGISFRLTQYPVGSLHKESSDFFYGGTILVKFSKTSLNPLLGISFRLTQYPVVSLHKESGDFL